MVADGPTARWPSGRALAKASASCCHRLPARVAVIDATEAKPDVRQTLLAPGRLRGLTGARSYMWTRQSAPASRRGRKAPRFTCMHWQLCFGTRWRTPKGPTSVEARQTRAGACGQPSCRDQRVDGVTALRYLKALRGPEPDGLLSERAALESGLHSFSRVLSSGPPSRRWPTPDPTADENREAGARSYAIAPFLPHFLGRVQVPHRLHRTFAGGVSHRPSGRQPPGLRLARRVQPLQRQTDQEPAGHPGRTRPGRAVPAARLQGACGCSWARSTRGRSATRRRSGPGTPAARAGRRRR